MSTIIIYSIAIVLCFAFGKFAVRFIYEILFLNLFRIIFLFSSVLILMLFKINIEKVYKFALFLFLFEFARIFYNENKEDIKGFILFFVNIIQIIYKIISFIFKTIAKIIMFFVDVKNGNLTEKQRLNQEKEALEEERLNFEYEKSKQKEEWERIKQAWDDLMREKGKSYEKEDRKEEKNYNHKENKSYSKSSSNKSQSSNHKRYFAEFAKFDLDNFEKNNPYEVLGVSKTSTKAEINKAYKKLIAKFHPDKFRHEGNVEKLEEAHKIAVLLNWGREECLRG